MNELLKRARPLLALLAATGRAAGRVARRLGEPARAVPIWTAVTRPGLAALLLEILVSLRRGDVGLDVVAGLSMSAALLFGEALAAAIVALMYAGGQLLEAFAERRARREMTVLLSRVPRTAIRHRAGALEEVPLDLVLPGDRLLVRQGDVVPVDGAVASGVAVLDQASKHIVARTIVAKAQARGLMLAIPAEVAETPGEGIAGKVEGRSVMVGSPRFIAAKLGRSGLATLAEDRPAGAVAVAIAIDGEPSGVLILNDALRAGTARLLDELRALGIERIVLATGDRGEVARFITFGLPIDLVRADLPPDQKVLTVLSERKRGPVMMIGDGVNDAPALAAAAFGFLPPGEGALFQEVFDVAVIFIALRALRG